jgi:hypothetical protein
MMIFSALAYYGGWRTLLNRPLYCNDTDFQNTLQMITVLVKHSNYVYTQIAQENLHSQTQAQERTVFRKSPLHTSTVKAIWL